MSIRALAFAAGGLMLADRPPGFAMLVPFALAGPWFGNRIHPSVSRESWLRLASALLLLIGVSLAVTRLAVPAPPGVSADSAAAW